MDEPEGAAASDDGGPVLRLRDVTVRFGDVDVLRQVSLSVEEGRITVLTGPSGSGKTTLLRLCNRLEVPTEGIVEFRGDDVSRLDPQVLRRRVGMVFQRPTLFPGSLHDNFLVAAAATDCAYREVLAMVGLPREWLDRPSDQLSGGEAQRACLARTLLTGPEVLLMDEPTSSLDEGASRAMEQLAVGLVGSGLTVLWVSHDLAQVERIADDCVVLMDGEVVGKERAAAYRRGASEPEGRAGGGGS